MPFKFRLKSLMRHREFTLHQARRRSAPQSPSECGYSPAIERLGENIRLESEQFEQEQEKGIEVARYLHFKGHLSLLEQRIAYDI